MDIYVLLVIGHIVGSVLGAGGATMIEVHLNRALADGSMSLDERGFLALDFQVVRIGLLITIFTGLGFVVLYNATGSEMRLQNPVFWAKMVMIVIVAVNALLLQAHKISLYWGSAFSLVTWWGVVFMGVFTTHSVRYGFFEIMIVYAILILTGAIVLHRARGFGQKKYGK